MESISPKEPPNRPLRLLSLDGGGIRGISELIILQEIMHRVGRVMKVETPLPADYFDMICGTSTGGLIAILLGRLRLSVPEAIDRYRVLAKQVFSERKHRVQDGTFKASKLETAIKETIEWKLGKGTAETKMFMADTVSCKTFVCAVPARHVGPPRLFRTWSADKGPGDNCAIWEAARATSAAPIFFKRILIGDANLQEEFIDAGLGCNNPVRHLVEEATKEFGLERRVDCIVSIGTGKPMVAGFKSPGLFQRVLPLELIKVLASIATDTEDEASRMKSRFQNCPRLYHRLNVEQGLQGISLEEWDKLGEIKSHTMAYLNDDTVSRGIDVIVDALVGKSSEAFPLGKLDGAVGVAVAAPVNNQTFYFLYPSHQVMHYVTRHDLMAIVDSHLRNMAHNVAPEIAILYGMGGCGKSQVALEYCRRGQKEGWFSMILWFDASSPMAISQSFADAAHKLSKPNFDIADAKGNLAFVLNMIEAYEFDSLLVFDNFDDPTAFTDDSIKEYLPRTGLASILFTTRHVQVEDMGLGIDATLMSHQEALELLLNRIHVERCDVNMQKGMNVVRRLGYHALAIDQAGAYIAARHIDLDTYMVHCHEREEHVLNEIPKQWDYRRRLKSDPGVLTKLSVFTTLELSIELISGSPTTRNDKIHFLTVAAFLNRDEVSDNLFRCYGTKNINWLAPCVKDGIRNKYIAQDILIELQSLSLIHNLQIDEHGARFSLHPLIQDWMKLRATPDARREFAREAVLLLSTFLKSCDENETPLTTKQVLHGHLNAVIQNEEKYPVIHGELESIELQDAAFNFGQFFNSQGRYNISEEMIRSSLKWRKQILGKEHPNTLQSMNSLGIALGGQAKHNEAKGVFEQTLQLREKILGKDHPDTLATMHSLAVVLDIQGEYKEAEQIFRQALKVREEILGKDHPHTLQSMCGLVVVVQRQGKFNEAMQIFQYILQLQDGILGEENPDTMRVMSGIGVVLQMKGDHVKAMQIFRHTHQLQYRILGEYHPDTLRTMSGIGEILLMRGEDGEAMQIFQNTLLRQNHIIGEEHPDTLRTLSGIGEILLKRGEYDESSQLLQHKLQLQEKSLARSIRIP